MTRRGRHHSWLIIIACLALPLRAEAQFTDPAPPQVREIRSGKPVAVVQGT